MCDAWEAGRENYIKGQESRSRGSPITRPLRVAAAHAKRALCVRARLQYSCERGEFFFESCFRSKGKRFSFFFLVEGRSDWFHIFW